MFTLCSRPTICRNIYLFILEYVLINFGSQLTVYLPRLVDIILTVLKEHVLFELMKSKIYSILYWFDRCVIILEKCQTIIFGGKSPSTWLIPTVLHSQVNFKYFYSKSQICHMIFNVYCLHFPLIHVSTMFIYIIV